MPRPPVKSKFAQRNQSARIANSSPAATLNHLENVLAKKPVGKRTAGSDDSDELVTAAQGSRNRRGKPRKEIYGSGGLGAEDQQNAHKRRGNKKQKLDVSQGPYVQVPSSQITQDGSQTQGPRAPLTASSSKANKPPTRGKILSPTLSAARQHNKAPLLTQSTPGLGQSMIGRGPPKKLPRESSILDLIDQDHSSYLDHDGEDSFGHLLPEDESTPVRLDASKPEARREVASTSIPSSQKRITTPPHGRPSATLATSPAQTLPSSMKENHVEKEGSVEEREHLDLPTERKARQPTITEEQTNISINTLAPPHSSSSPLPSPKDTTRHATPSRKTTNDPGPAALSMTGQDALPKKTAQKKTAGPAQLSTDELRQSLLPKRRRRAQRQQYDKADEFDIPEDSEDGVSTHARDHHLDSAEDELSFQPTTGRGSKRASSVKAKTMPKARAMSRVESDKRTNKKRDAKKKGNGVKPALQKSSTTTVTPFKSNGGGTTAKSSQKPGKGGATYSSRRHRTDADKENEPFDTSDEYTLPASSVEEVPNVLKESAELQEVARKFAEIDDWDMEFEDVTPEGHSSSPSRR